MHGLHGMARLAVMLACICATSSFAGTAGTFEGWELEHSVDPPSYAVIDPQSTDLNIDSVVLVCEEAGNSRGLQLQLYLSTEGPLLPKGVPVQRLKDDPSAEIAIDGRIFPVAILFADDYVVLADETAQIFPRLSWLSRRGAEASPSLPYAAARRPQGWLAPGMIVTEVRAPFWTRGKETLSIACVVWPSIYPRFLQVDPDQFRLAREGPILTNWHQEEPR